MALQSMTKEERLNNIIQSGIQYNTLSSNLKLTVKPGKKSGTTVDAQLRVVKAEAIQLSLRVPILGTEAVKILITPDNLLFIDRINKIYLSESMHDIKSKAPFDFDYYSLEALLTNQLFIAGKKEITRSDYPAFQLQEDAFLVNIAYTDKQAIRYDFTGDYSNRIQSARMNQEKWKSQLQCTYTGWGLTSNKRIFPMSVNMTLNIPNEIYTANFTYKSVDVNTDFSIDYTVPNRYKQVTLQQVLKLIGNLL
ncbi:hypothetical protein FACS189474_1740 [Bacteroidia bacterium]|nr:hypothetical protein FACS189474_1740 [Bacteroidia bacterium]